MPKAVLPCRRGLLGHFKSSTIQHSPQSPLAMMAEVVPHCRHAIVLSEASSTVTHSLFAGYPESWPPAVLHSCTPVIRFPSINSVMPGAVPLCHRGPLQQFSTFACNFINGSDPVTGDLFTLEDLTSMKTNKAMKPRPLQQQASKYIGHARPF